MRTHTGKTVPTTGVHIFSGAFPARARAGKGDVKRALETASTNGTDPWHLQHQLPDPGHRRSGAQRAAAPNPASLRPYPMGAPWCPTGGSEAPHSVALQIPKMGIPDFVQRA